MKKILLILIPILLAAAIGVGAFIAFAQSDGKSKNPLKNIRQSISKHDIENFYKLVDVDAVLNNAAEEILTAQINSNVDALAYSTQDFVNKYENLKPEFLNAAHIYLDEYIKTGKINFQPPFNPAQKFFKDSAVANCAIKSFSKLKIEGDEAHSTVDFYNAGMNFYFALELTLKKVDKNWKVTSVKGFDSFLSGYNRALRKQLENLNAPIRADIKDIASVKGFSASVTEGDEYGFSKTLKIKFKANIKADKPLSKIVGNILIDGKDDRVGITPFSIDTVGSEAGEQIFEIEKVLNPFVREDADVMRHGLRKNNLHIEITQIEFADGSTLKEFDELPD